jgi:hypothetical protein
MFFTSIYILEFICTKTQAGSNVKCLLMAMLRQLVAGFPLWWPRFDPRSSHVGFAVDKVALGQDSCEYYSFPCQFSFHQMLHTHLSSGAGTVGRLVMDV